VGDLTLDCIRRKVTRNNDSIELVYGRWFGYFKEKLDVGQVVTFTILLTGLMVLLSVLRTRRRPLRSTLRAPAPVQAGSPSGG
jgi:hypothetical protein